MQRLFPGKSATCGALKNSMRKPDIIPAILVHSRAALAAELDGLRGAPLVQVDLVGENFLKGEEMPLWEEFDFEFDLMTDEQLADARVAVSELGASRVVVHAERPQAREALEALQQFRSGEFKVEVGVALLAHGSVEELAEYEGLYDFVQVMGIDRVGVQGQPFDVHHKALELVCALRAAHPALFIQVDGGVKADNFQSILDAGANRLVVGSAYREVLRQMS